jgi:uncharacterized membrane protein
VNQQDFLNALYLELEKLPYVNKDGLVAHYQNIFRMGLELGQTEEEIAAQLGSPQAIAGYYEAHHMIGLAELESSLRNLFYATKAVLRLGISNLVLILGPVLGVFGAMAALLAAGAAVSLAGIFLFGGVLLNLLQPGIADIPPAFYSDGLTAAATLCMSVGFIALGLLFLIGDYYLGRILYRGTLRHLDFHLRLTRREDTYAQ